ncbi:stage II sporulation protein M [Candidatus Woesearchaeota archaeon]|nr:stage II sporulation protein M [Candidatus Woesearchaeota archaeon]
MVLESLLFPMKAEKKPWEMFFIGLLYSTVGIFLALWIFERQSSFVMVFFIVLACVPIVYNTLKWEESKDLELDSPKKILKEHNKAIMVLSFLFLGIIVSGVIWYVFLPAQKTGFLFEQQISTIAEINNKVSPDPTGLATSSSLFFRIFFNNIKVLIFCILFAFIYGAGAVFILTWNATVISAAVGNFIRSKLAPLAGLSAVGKATGYFTLVSAGFLRYAIHGIPEILSYFYGGIAGGIISVAIIKNHFATEKSADILFDVGELLLIAVGFVFIGAILEVFVTPLLF